MMKKILFLPLILLTFGLFAQGYQIGDKVDNFTLKNVDGSMITMDVEDENIEGYILVFTCNHCPYSKLYEDRIIMLDNNFKSKNYPVIAINSNDPEQYEEDSFENMVLRAKEKAYPFPYVLDETQDVAKAFGATKTPHTFLVKKEGKDLILKYIGSIDDSPRDDSAVEEKYVEDAIAKLKAGKELSRTRTAAVGCSIKWKK